LLILSERKVVRSMGQEFRQDAAEGRSAVVKRTRDIMMMPELKKAESTDT
jgi:hypothetical protein